MDFKRNKIKDATLEINLNSVKSNARYVLNNTKNGLIAVVKNNAYNFGLKKTVKALYKVGVRFFATTSLRDCISMRNLYSDIGIFSLNPSVEFDILRKYSISCTIPNMFFLKENMKDMKGISWHLEWAGKMRRSGCRTEEELLNTLNLALEKNLDIEGMWTHFSWADEFDEDKTYEKEVEEWNNVLIAAKKVHSFSYVHSQNSASFVRNGLLDGHTHVRLGIYLYGCQPYNYKTQNDYKGLDKNNNINVENRLYNIKHAITLKASVIAINELNKGEGIGYCSSYVAKSLTKVAVINIGYGEGILRNRVNKGYVIINNKKYDLVSLMMSHTVAVVDDDVKIGDAVYFYGKDIPVHEFTFMGVASNSEQISMLNYNTLEVLYINGNI